MKLLSFTFVILGLFTGYSCEVTKLQSTCDLPTSFYYQFPNGYFGMGTFTYLPEERYLNRISSHVKIRTNKLDSTLYEYSILRYRFTDQTVSDSINYIINISNTKNSFVEKYYKIEPRDSLYFKVTANLEFISQVEVVTNCGAFIIQKYQYVIGSSCYIIYVEESLGVFKAYGPDIYFDKYQLEFRYETKEEKIMREILQQLRMIEGFISTCDGTTPW